MDLIFVPSHRGEDGVGLLERVGVATKSLEMPVVATKSPRMTRFANAIVKASI